MLTDTAIRNAKFKGKNYKLSDGTGNGFYVLVKKAGKYFRFDFRFEKKRKTLALGVYPDVSLSLARERLAEARAQLAEGIDPCAYRKTQKALDDDNAANSFETIAREWVAKKSSTWTDEYAKTIIKRLETNIFPWLGKKPIVKITASDLLKVLRRIEERGAIETAHRIKQTCGQIFRYAIASDRAERDPSTDLRGALSSTKPESMATITDPRQIAGLLRVIEDYKGTFITRYALRFAPLTFVRPGELRHAEWEEFDFDQAEWKIPAEKMKMRVTHIVPLSRQAIAVLKELEPLTGKGRYVFPSLRTGDRPMSENTVNSALRRMGYSKEEMTGHGFRAMASTLLHEQGWPSDIIERQLAHRERNSVKAVYNHAQHLAERRKMMQVWADYLDSLKEGGKIIPFPAKVA